jgi:hypothetical protein
MLRMIQGGASDSRNNVRTRTRHGNCYSVDKIHLFVGDYEQAKDTVGRLELPVEVWQKQLRNYETVLPIHDRILDTGNLAVACLMEDVEYYAYTPNCHQADLILHRIEQRTKQTAKVERATAWTT